MAVHKFTNFKFDAISCEIFDEVKLFQPRIEFTLDKYYLKSLLLSYIRCESYEAPFELLDALPVISLADTKDDPFYLISVKRLQNFVDNELPFDGYVGHVIKHLFVYIEVLRMEFVSINGYKLLKTAMSKIQPQFCTQWTPGQASLIPTLDYDNMLIVPVWIDGALHYNEGSIIFVAEHLHIGKVIPSSLNKQMEQKIIQSRTSQVDSVFNDIPSWLCQFYVCQSKFWVFGKESPFKSNETEEAIHVFRSESLAGMFNKLIPGMWRSGPIYYYRNRNVFNGSMHKVRRDNSSVCNFFCIGYIGGDADGTMLRIVEPQSNSTHFIQLKTNHIYIVPDLFNFYVEGEAMRQFLMYELIEIIEEPLAFVFVQAKNDILCKNRLQRGFRTLQQYDQFYYAFKYDVPIFKNMCLQKKILVYTTDESLLLPAQLNYVEYQNHLYFNASNYSSEDEKQMILAVIFWNRYIYHKPNLKSIWSTQINICEFEEAVRVLEPLDQLHTMLVVLRDHSPLKVFFKMYDKNKPLLLDSLLESSNFLAKSILCIPSDFYLKLHTE